MTDENKARLEDHDHPRRGLDKPEPQRPVAVSPSLDGFWDAVDPLPPHTDVKST